MPPSTEQTRSRLIAAATRGFAEQGVHTASLLDISRRAGQRNRGAVHYHFGSRTGMLVAVIEQFTDLLAARERELIAAARLQPDSDVASVVRALVLPALELADLGSRGRHYLMILAELVEDDSDAMAPEVFTALEHSGGWEAWYLLESRVGPMPDEVRAERLSLATVFILRAIADRGRADERPTGRAQLDSDRFASNLVEMVVGMLTAPVESTSVPADRD